MDGKKIFTNKDDQRCSKDFSEVINSKQEVLKNSNTCNGNWWINDQEEEKVDSRKRWSFGSDTSEPVERVQNRLCCSPVDFDSPASSENEELIVNSLDESDEGFKKYIAACPKVSPSCSPTFEKVNYSGDKKKSNKNHDADTADDELIDYSKIYVTEKDYAETDLDQPTDYSLRYPDEEDKKESQFYCTNLPDDTVKTYHTEGTPNNFSNATSMTDLLSLEDSKENYEANYKCQFSKEQRPNKTVKDYKKVLKLKNIPQDSKPALVLKEVKEIKNDKPQTKFEKIPSSPQSPAESCNQNKVNETETLKSEETYAQETPLMYSRCSSLDSLNEFDQHSIHDDHSSVISDFSHRTSGAVSPSDLPDSPTQTVPPSPTKLKQQINLPQKTPQNPSRREFSTINQKVDGKTQGVKHFAQVPEPLYEKPNDTNKENRGFFEDSLVTFEKESMISNRALSTTGSILSSLTIDDDEGSIYNSDNRDIIDRIAAIRVRTSAAGMHQAPTQKLQCNKVSNESDKSTRQVQHNKVLNKPLGRTCDSLFPSPGRDHVDFVNAEDKNSHGGMYDNKESFIKYRNSPKDHWYDNDVKNENPSHSNKLTPSSPIYKRNEFNYAQKTHNDEIIATDTLRTYCTEDTPTFVSPFSSQSNLSALSMLSISDDDSNFQEQQRFAYEKRFGAQENPYDSNPNSDSSDNDYCYDDDTPHLRRIDVSPFDSQLNLANLSLVCIEEENEEDIKEEESREKINYETDRTKKEDDAEADDANDNCDFSEAERKVFEECVNSGVSKLTRRILHVNGNK